MAVKLSHGKALSMLSMASLAALAILCCRSLLADDLLDGKSIWTRIANTRSDIELTKESADMHWLEIHADCQKAFTALEKSPDVKAQRAAVDHYVEQFGKHGPTADLRWAFAASDLLLFRVRNVKPRPKGGQEYREAFNRRVLSPALLARASKDKDFRRRFWHLLVYADRRLMDDARFPIFLGMTTQAIREMDVERPDETQAYYTFSFLLILHATGRDDLADGIDVKNAKKRLEEWTKWGEQNARQLRPSKDSPVWIVDKDAKPIEDDENLLPPNPPPPFPLPDWDKSIPPPSDEDVFTAF